MTLIVSHFNPLHIRLTYLSKMYATMIFHVYTKWCTEAVQQKFYMNFLFTMFIQRGARNAIQGGARNVIPLIVQVTHFYYYKNI